MAEQMVEVDALATVLDISGQWVRDLSKKGVLPEIINGKLPFLSSTRSYIRWLRAENQRNSQSAAAASVHSERARMLALRNAKEAATLVEAESVGAVLCEVVGSVRSELAGLSAACTRDMGLRRIIDFNVDGIVTRLREKLSALGDHHRLEAELHAISGESGND